MNKLIVNLMIVFVTAFLFVSVAEAKSKGVGSVLKGAFAKTVSTPISKGHSLKKHGNQFPKVKQAVTEAQKTKKLRKEVERVITRGEKKQLKDNRVAYGLPYNTPKKDTVVIVNPKDKDKGTVFKPSSKTYFERLK